MKRMHQRLKRLALLHLRSRPRRSRARAPNRTLRGPQRRGSPQPAVRTQRRGLTSAARQRTAATGSQPNRPPAAVLRVEQDRKPARLRRGLPRVRAGARRLPRVPTARATELIRETVRPTVLVQTGASPVQPTVAPVREPKSRPLPRGASVMVIPTAPAPVARPAQPRAAAASPGTAVGRATAAPPEKMRDPMRGQHAATASRL